ncbi:MAG: NifB/NifX family molybdenum-iron cluster-binding protein [Spirochaetes bacterium]|nr:NifB/NifX family molybdenum-iron cluster-binding protein [Spirochaetota bacterium]
MKIAIPLANGALCMHFGHCEQFALVEADTENKKITSTEFVTPPAHEPGLLPRWLSEKGAKCIIAGGMGGRAVEIFNSHNIKVITGAQPDVPEKIVEAYLNNTLVTGQNTCDH